MVEKNYKEKLEQMEGFELRAEEERIKREFYSGNLSWEEAKKISLVFLEVQNARTKAIYTRNKKSGFKPRSFVGFLR